MCEYPKGPKRDRRPRVVVDLSPESADALRGWAKGRMMQVRDAPAHMVSLLATHDSHVQRLTFAMNEANAVRDASEDQRIKERRDYRETVADLQSEIANLQSELASHEEARRTALKHADKWQQRADEISRDSGAEIAELSGQLSTCRRQIAECEGLRRAAIERANKLERDLARLHQMTAWDHVRAAIRRAGWLEMTAFGLVGFLFGHGLSGFGFSVLEMLK